MILDANSLKLIHFYLVARCCILSASPGFQFLILCLKRSEFSLVFIHFLNKLKLGIVFSLN